MPYVWHPGVIGLQWHMSVWWLVADYGRFRLMANFGRSFNTLVTTLWGFYNFRRLLFKPSSIYSIAELYRTFMQTSEISQNRFRSITWVSYVINVMSIRTSDLAFCLEAIGESQILTKRPHLANLGQSCFIEIQFYQTIKQNITDLLWMAISHHLKLPPKLNLYSLVSLVGCLFGKIEFR